MLCFRSDVELSYNVDGRPTSIYGTMPDVFLMQVPYPSELTKEALLSDEWINWAIKHDFFGFSKQVHKSGF